MAHVDPREARLARAGILNTRPERVRSPGFQEHAFLDARDLGQVRYELLRAARVEGLTVTAACEAFGFSREYFYALERAFKDRGLAALLGRTRGRPRSIAANQEIVSYVTQRKLEDPALTGEALRQELSTVFGVTCSRRTVERLLARLGCCRR